MIKPIQVTHRVNIRCRLGFHKWTVFCKSPSYHAVKRQHFLVLHLGCLRCSKTKIVTRAA